MPPNIYENAATVKVKYHLKDEYPPWIEPVSPETSIRRQSDKSNSSWCLAIKSRISMDTS
jgi:hypothetical protein